MVKEYVWYACYGSNLFTERFMAYIKGNNIPGTTVGEVGCRDKSDPLKIEKYIFKHQLYFDGVSKRWNKKGVGFISDIESPNCITYGKKYLITEEQFIDIVCQENNVIQKESIIIPIKGLLEGKNHIVFPNKMYGKILCVGKEEGIPILTFTSTKEKPEVFNPPSLEYLNMIALGIYETHNISRDEIVDYLGGLCGIKNHYSREFLYQNINSLSCTNS